MVDIGWEALSDMDAAGLTFSINPTREAVELAILSHLKYTIGKTWDSATLGDLYMSLAYTVRDLAMDVMLETEQRYRREDVKLVHYISMEFLVGRSLGNNLINLGVYDICKDAVSRLGYDIDEMRDEEVDPALGNGGLGRLAACFLDSMATLGIPGYGYGINYEFGLFRQEFENGYQVERPDHWRASGNPWQIERPDQKVLIPLKGRVVAQNERPQEGSSAWTDWQTLVGVPYDMPIVGYGAETVNRLRLYAARASDEFDVRIFNQGDYTRAVEQKILSETVSKILYPSDSVRAGQELRLTQEYFLVACALRDVIRRYKRAHATIDAFPDKVAIQLNDTHPALAVAELMRILVDEEGVPWTQAWSITTRTLAFTNHTLMPEALETWPVPLVEYLLPRHLQIIYEINQHFLGEAAPAVADDPAALARVSLIDEHGERRVRMANLAIIGSHAVNGVAQIHSRLLTETIFRDFYRIWPQKFTSVTNGITPRRWLLKANPRLADAITRRIGPGWITDLERVRTMTPFADDGRFREEFAAIKHANKVQLAALIAATTGVTVDPTSLFDVQVKRLHEYKRQLLNALHIIHLYLELLADPEQEITPRTFIFAAKAAPGYWMAKLIIKCINNIAAVVNSDPVVRGRLRVVFLPDYRVTLAEQIMPAADLSEQISTAGKEASGTGNMKLALNGALTIGTLDGANVEIAAEVGPENIYIFGLRVEEVEALRQSGYHPRALYEADPRIRRVVDALQSDIFCKGEPGLFQPLVDSLLNRDEYFLLADFAAYIETQTRVAVDFRDTPAWTRRAILNVAGAGKFSSDRAVTEYARDLWHVQPQPPADEQAMAAAD